MKKLLLILLLAASAFGQSPQLVMSSFTPDYKVESAVINPDGTITIRISDLEAFLQRTGGGGGAASFASLAGGTNTAGTFTCGTGCTITTSGSGSIVATSGSVLFSGVGAGTNANALVIGTGGTLATTGTGKLTGTILFDNAASFDGNSLLGGTGNTLNINSASNRGISVIVGNGITGQTASSLLLQAGAGNATGFGGGAASLVAGSSPATGFPGGAIAITGGAATAGVATDTAGGNITVQCGIGTGAATGCSIIFQTSVPVGSGTGAQTNTTQATITNTKLNFPSGNILSWNADSGISRLGAASLCAGNGTNADCSGTWKAATINATTALQVNGTAASTITLKKGTGAGNYTSASTTYVVVDSTNLCFTVTIPTGFKLSVAVNTALGTATGAVVASMALTDNAACSTANAGILVETTETTTAAATLQAIGLGWVITGDGAAHNIALQFKTSNGTDSATILNSSSTSLPTMVFTMVPSS